MQTDIRYIDYSAFETLPKPNKKEPLLVALLAVIFIIVSVIVMILSIRADAGIDYTSGWLLLAIFGFIIGIFFWLAIRQDKSTLLHRQAMRQFTLDNSSQFKVELYQNLEQYTTNSIIINSGKYGIQPLREFLLRGNMNGCDFKIYNGIVSSKTNGKMIKDSTRTIIEITLSKGSTTPTIIGDGKLSEVTNLALNEIFPRPSDRKDYGVRYENYTVYFNGSEPPMRRSDIEQIMASIKDTLRWSAFEVTNDSLYLFGNKRLYFRKKDLKDALEQADATVHALNSIE